MKENGGAYKRLEGRRRDWHGGVSCGRLFGGAGLVLLWYAACELFFDCGFKSWVGSGMRDGRWMCFIYRTRRRTL